MLSHDEIRNRAAAAFGDWALCRVEEQAVLAAISHEPTRRFLADVGVPLHAPFFTFDLRFFTQPETFRGYVANGYYLPDGPGRPLRQVMVRQETLDEWGHLVRFGDDGEESLWLDPASGAVRAFFAGWDDPPCLVNSALSQYVWSLAHIEQQRFIDGVSLEDIADDESAYERLEEITEQLERSDPAAFDACEHGAPWAGWLDDPLAWGGLEWTWSEVAVEYLRARGTDPSEREPRRPVVGQEN